MKLATCDINSCPTASHLVSSKSATDCFGYIFVDCRLIMIHESTPILGT